MPKGLTWLELELEAEKAINGAMATEETDTTELASATPTDRALSNSFFLLRWWCGAPHPITVHTKNLILAGEDILIFRNHVSIWQINVSIFM